MVQCSKPGRAAGWQRGEVTHICLDKQLPCLYPFPQRSQRSSGLEPFPSPLTRWPPSLARRFRFLVLIGLPEGALPSTTVWAICEPSWARFGDALRATGESRLGLLTLRERYEPKAEVAPTELDSKPFRLPRRWAGIAIPVESGESPKEAATAAAALAAAVVVTLFRRVTRWFEFTAPREIE